MKEEQVRNTPESLTERIAEKLGVAARAETIFGPVVERDGVAVVPVAKIRWGVGGGKGGNPERGEEGSGAGGGVVASPVGYIEISEKGARYRPIFSISTIVGSVLAGGIVASIILKARRRCGETT